MVTWSVNHHTASQWPLSKTEGGVKKIKFGVEREKTDLQRSNQEDRAVKKTLFKGKGG